MTCPMVYPVGAIGDRLDDRIAVERLRDLGAGVGGQHVEDRGADVSTTYPRTAAAVPTTARSPSAQALEAAATGAEHLREPGWRTTEAAAGPAIERARAELGAEGGSAARSMIVVSHDQDLLLCVVARGTTHSRYVYDISRVF